MWSVSILTENDAKRYQYLNAYQATSQWQQNTQNYIVITNVQFR